MENIIETINVTKEYGHVPAVEDINLHVHQGDIYGMIGRNGAGKTTILRMLSGLASPTKGDILLLGSQVKVTDEAFQAVGTLIENPGIIPGFTAEENLQMKCTLCGINDTAYCQNLLSMVGLAKTGKKKAGRFSMGMKQRLGIALALVGEPKIVILDEPINGLDPQGILETRELIERLNRERGITFIISSHILGELEKIATRYGIIHDGRLIKELDAEQMQMESGGDLEKFYFEMTGGNSHNE